ncbi:Lipid A core - O-antigen ligase and related enzymes [Serratia fonticola]|uniref:PglL family O-oligosaccharyltransferase n=1 Tax=Serratia fonticola TaxID=47917 RepID=UPI0021829254|nr:PglL family O-oligosaccharyltransferase [Serratia fonticola]CAI2142648.1 Lipid A core - O-antigen ligase and related enzymes [Serratia fonticola]
MLFRLRYLALATLLLASVCFWPNRGGSGFFLPVNMLIAAWMSLLVIASFVQCHSALMYSSCSRWLLAGGVILTGLPWLTNGTGELYVIASRLMGLGLGLAFYFALLQYRFTQAARAWVIQGCLLLALLQAGLGTAQYYLFAADNYMGYNTLLNRPYGIFQQWNVMASLMATGLALALYLSMPRNGMRLSHWATLAAVMMLVMAPLLLVLIGSRIGLLAALLVTPLQLWDLWRLDRRRCILAMGLIALGVALALLSQWNNGVARDVAQGSTLSYRLQVWRICLAMITDRPWLGWGYGQFSTEFSHYAHRLLPDTLESFQMAHPHNELLFWGVEDGLVGLAAVGLIVVGVIRLCIRRTRFRHGWLGRLSQSPWLLMVPIVLHTQVEFPLYQSALHGIMLLLLLRVCDVRHSAFTPRYAVQSLRWGLISVALFCLIYLLNGLYVSQVITAVERDGLKNIARYQRFISPHPWQQRQVYDQQLTGLLNYAQNPQTQVLNDYLAWGESYLRHTPDVNVYINLSVVNQLLGNTIRAEQLHAEARRLYPQEKRL